jgi:prepilin-type N-terminal cleavage/methylation domain-containing protein
MRTYRDNERGDTLIEILIAIVLIGLMMGALYGSITLGATGSNNQKNLATADGLLRNYAESAKTTVKAACASGNNFTVTAPTAPWDAPSGPSSVSSTPNLSTQNCPSKTSAPGVLLVQLSVTVPHVSQPKTLQIALRSP